LNPAKIFPEPIWIGHYDGDLSLVKSRALKLFNASNKLNAGLERAGGQSSSSDPDMPHTWPEITDFLDWCDDLTAIVWQDWHYPKADRMVINSWANIHPKGAWTDEHTHNAAGQVIVLYVEQPENGGNLEIFNPMFYNWESTLRESGHSWKELEVKTGDVVVFPGWVLHRTQPNQTDDTRIVMSFNVGLRPQF
jgi:uncharacterized protein (TIGR02466 family)